MKETLVNYDGEPNQIATEAERYVSDYLIAHPDFFRSHTQLLTKLNIPHPSGRAVSLLERQVEVLRKENHRLEKRMVDWMETARENDQLLLSLHNFSASLVQDRSLADHSLRTLELLRSEFDTITAEVYVLKNESITSSSGFRYIDLDARAMEELAGVLRQGTPVCRALSKPLQEYLLPDFPQVASIALVPLGEGSIWGFLLMGSRDRRHFHANLDTTYLTRLGALVDAALDPQQK